MKTRITPGSLKEHISYNWWKYLLIIAIGAGLVDLLYSVTAYRPPREKTVSLCVYGYTDEPGLTAWLDQVHETEMSDMEEVTVRTLTIDDAYGPMQLMTFFAAGEGDVYILPREQFLSYASSGTMLPLENDQELMALFDSAGISLQSGWRRDTETGDTHLFGIPLDKLSGLSQYAYVKDGFLCVPVSGGNQENAIKLLRIICRDLMTAAAPQTDQQEGQP